MPFKNQSRSARGNAHILGFGGLGQLYTPKLTGAAATLGGTSSLISAGTVDLNQTVADRTPVLRIPGVVCTSPSPDQIRHAIGNQGLTSIARETQRDWEDLVFGMVDALLASQLRSSVLGAQLIALIGARTGHGLPFELGIRRAKKSDPTLTIVPLSAISTHYDQRLQAQQGLDLFRSLTADQVTPITFLFDNDGNYARRHTEARQDVAVAKAIAALVCASALMLRNRAMVEVGRSLSKESPFGGISVASMPIQGYSETLGEKVSRFVSPSRPKINLTSIKHIVRQAELAIEAALTDPDARTMADGPVLGTTMHASFIVPLRVDERSLPAWELVTSGIQQAIRLRWPTVSTFYCAGNGAPHPGHVGTSWLQCSLFYSLPATPTIPLRTEDDDEERRDVVETRVVPTRQTRQLAANALSSAPSRNGH